MTRGPHRVARYAIAFAMALAIAGAVASCGTDQRVGSPQPTLGSSPIHPPGVIGDPSPGGTPSGGLSDPFRQIDQDTQGLVDRVATWHAPSHLVVDRSTRVGLSIGTGSEITNEVNTLVQNDVPTDAGTVQVGPTVTATLEADSDDATVTPSVAVDASTGSDVELLWTWTVRAIHPSDDLLLTVHLAIPLVGGHVLTRDLPLSIPVSRTFSYTVHQFFDSWGTWSAIGGTIIAVGGWWAARRRKQRRNGTSKRPCNGPPKQRGPRRGKYALDFESPDGPKPRVIGHNHPTQTLSLIADCDFAENSELSWAIHQ